MSLTFTFDKHFKHLSPAVRKLVVAYSGGLDSSVLLSLSAAYAKRNPHIRVIAVHVNHGLQQQANSWQEHCRQQASLLEVRFYSEALNIKLDARQSLEAVAREARYAALTKYIGSKDSLLLTGHHADDQFETFMLALKRGSGVNGLAAMPLQRPFAQGSLLRPLLAFSRAELEDYAQSHQLTWIDDPSNESMDYDRNFLRHQVMATLSLRWPQILKTTQRSVQHLQEANQLATEIAESDYSQVGENGALSCSALHDLSEARRNNLLRHWFTIHDWLYPSQAQLGQIVSQSLAKQDAKVSVKLSEGEVRRFKGRLYLVAKQCLIESSHHQPWNMNSVQHLLLENHSKISWYQGGNLLPPKLGEVVTLRFRSELTVSDFVAAEHNGRRSIKKLLQEAQLPSWQRNRIPFVFYDDCLVAIGDLYTNASLQADNNQGIRFSWTPAC
ncbi:tRNA lysidine(34) synthetase TilS [Agarivorans sp. TSD2052]|uniref:tRNA lysidine(34) synthetase TilS n=1 Tax=Agarivorans sp. TSD2052 TaxID=2937286 RepID=UPI00200BFD53|nr:tRNA lysidine(34) synthetase TilS [Agarivorans sp. TSD2052]UPW17133.1 tRNA lysidine(34) synthetase TilS [Agarivorans sp. TSD2052]